MVNGRIADTLGCEVCRDAPGGHGLVAARGARAHLNGFDVARAATCGVLVDGDFTAVDLEGGSLRESAIGACIQVAGYDVARVRNGVIYTDNGLDIVETSLPVPPPPDLPRPPRE
jgi:hypothetical protein